MAQRESSLKEVSDVVNCRVQWTEAMTKLLLAVMNEHVESFKNPVNKQVWKDVAASMNTHGYNLSAENCNIKWTGMKKNIKR